MPNQLDFFALKALRDRLAGMLHRHAITLHEYESEDGKGYCHQITDRREASVASTATCVASLVAVGKWNGATAERTPVIAEQFLSKRASAGLDPDNPFSLAFMAEGVLDLTDVSDYENSAKHRETIQEDHAKKLIEHLKSEADSNDHVTRLNVRGAIAIAPYPPSAYLTQLVLRVLLRLDMVSEDLRLLVHGWSRAEISKQVALIAAKSRTADPLQLAYALILAVHTASDQQTSPEDKEIFSHALGVFFDQQLEDGSWPLSRPMFHYAKVGNAYCFDFELLTQLLLCEPLRDDLLRYLPELERAVRLAERTSYDLAPDLPGSKLAWASGHHPQLEGPESWSTASVYHFAHALDRVVAEGIRRALFAELGSIYPGPPAGPKEMPPTEGVGDFAAENFLDADLQLPDGHVYSLKEVLARRFVFRIAHEADKVRRGGRLSKSTPMSAILFGPPGTSKTQLAKIISKYLGWPLISVDPSYLVQEGLDRVQAMANRLFSMLASVEQVVVLLDEFDEMGRNRSGNAELLSRFITTAMLPKLAAINEERKIVFLLATNYVRGFDAAFSRGGRFDMRLQVMQPNLASKLSNSAWQSQFEASLGALSPEQRGEAERHIGRLTYLETEELVKALRNIEVPDEISSIISLADVNGTLSKTNIDASADSTTSNGASNKPNSVSAKIANAGSVPSGELEVNNGTASAGAEKHVPPTWGDTCQLDREEIRLPAEF